MIINHVSVQSNNLSELGIFYKTLLYKPDYYRY